MSERDEGLIKFLMKNKHGTPFEHGFFRFVVKCPIFVAREWHRHRIGHSYNEWSGRYSKIEPEFYVPDFIREQTGKPGAYNFEEVDTVTSTVTQAALSSWNKGSFEMYEKLLAAGIAKEQARLVLPGSVYTKFYWSCNPRSLMHFLELRTSEHAMYEIKCYANAATIFLGKHMPITRDAFVDNDWTAP